MKQQILEIKLRELVEETHDCAEWNCYNHDVSAFLELINKHVNEVIGEDEETQIDRPDSVTYQINEKLEEQRERAKL